MLNKQTIYNMGNTTKTMKLLLENWRQYLKENVEKTLGEGITDVVFHKTRLDLAADILDSNKFMTSVAFGTPADREHNKGKLYYLSTMRSPTGDYGPSLPAVTFGLDGRKLGERSKAAAVDYWGPNFPKDEMEDRVFTDEPYLSPATKYITEIHVGLPISDGHPGVFLCQREDIWYFKQDEAPDSRSMEGSLQRGGQRA